MTRARRLLRAAVAPLVASWFAAATAAQSGVPSPAAAVPNGRNAPESRQEATTPATPPGSSPPSVPAEQSVLTPEVRARLESLVPSRPELYYELGEEIADIARDRRGAELARHLYVLAFHLDRARGGQQLAAQACLAIAHLNGNDKDRRWLLSLAYVLDRRYARPDWIRRADDAVSSQVSYTAAVVLGLVRSGEGYVARQRLAEPGVAALLTTFERLLSPTGDTGAMRWIERELGRWPCPECHNQRIVKKGGGKDAIVKLCITCGGNPGPKLDNPALVAHLRFESRLLHGIQRSWAAQAWSDQGAPLRDPDPEELAKQFGVEPERTLWRDGRWVAPSTIETSNPRASVPTVPDADTPSPDASKK